MPLTYVIKKTEEAVNQKKNPVILFDLDDTLIDTRFRKLAILKELAESPVPSQEFHSHCEILKTASIKHLKYRVKDSLAALGIFHDGFIEYCENFWKERNFSDRYVELDRPIQGAVRYVNWLHRKGATIIYLTGRDELGMGKGTLKNLQELEFPLKELTHLIMKPDARIPDLEFKTSVLDNLKQFGEVIAIFENEGKNLVAMANKYQNATKVILDTIKSPDQPKFPFEVHQIKNFI